MNVVTPNLRFKTYSKPWEVQALGKLGSFLGGGTPSTENRAYWSGGIPWVSSSDIKEGDFFGINLHRFITEDAIKNSATKKVPENSLLIVSRVGVGKFSVCRHEVCTSQDFTSFTPENCSIDFIAYQLYKNKNRLINLGQGTTIKGFTTGDLASFKLHIPEKDEQQKIADFLTSVDTKISQLTEKRRLLKDYKKGVMQQIFSQQIRFKDDDGNAFPDWEDKLLGDIATFTKGKSISKADISIDGMTPCIRYGELYTTYGEVIESVVSATNLPIKSLLFSEANDVIVPSSGETQWDIATAACVKLSDVAYSGDLTVIRTPLNGVFLSYYFNSDKKREIASLSQGSSVIHLYSTHLKSLKIEVPCEAEQQKIAQFLQSLDKKIDAVNDQIKQTKLFKKGLLQQMFV